MYRLNLYIPLVLVTIFMLFITIMAVIYFQEEAIHKHKNSISEQFQSSLAQQVKDESEEIKEYIDFIKDRSKTLQLFRSSDKKELYNNMIEVYKRLNKGVDLTHMYFIRTDGTILLRVHDYKRDGDFVDRTTFLKAQESQSLFYGLEFGIKKNYTLRVVEPWIVDGELIGYIELGKEIDRFITKLSKLLNTHIYMAVNKNIFVDSPQYVKDRLKQKKETANYHIVYNTFSVPKEVESIIDGTAINQDIFFLNEEYYTSRAVLSDVSGKELGYFIFLSNVSLEHSVMYNSIKILSVILALTATLLLTIGFLIIRRKEKSINTLTSKLEVQKENLAHFNIRLQKLFDLQKNMVILTDTKNLQMANQAVFNFFGFKDLDAFLQQYNCICERFIVHENFFHLGDVDDGESWVETIQTISNKKHIVAMQDKYSESHAFSVSVNEFEKGEFIISFTDISDTMIEQSELKYKVSHDKLTKAYNREFFDYNIDKIIDRAHPQKLGVVLCDIDYFKKVNDTYGHNCGDSVLKHLVKLIEYSIRKEDYLIRWGGEEFVMLMTVDSKESLHKAVDNIRLTIEKEPFDVVEHITCSFGATLHLYNQEIVLQTIERADRALYKAKEAGRNQVQTL